MLPQQDADSSHHLMSFARQDKFQSILSRESELKLAVQPKRTWWQSMVQCIQINCVRCKDSIVQPKDVCLSRVELEKQTLVAGGPQTQ